MALTGRLSLKVGPILIMGAGAATGAAVIAVVAVVVLAGVAGVVTGVAPIHKTAATAQEEISCQFFTVSRLAGRKRSESGYDNKKNRNPCQIYAWVR